MALYGGRTTNHTSATTASAMPPIEYTLAPILVAKDADVALQVPTTCAVSDTTTIPSAPASTHRQTGVRLNATSANASASAPSTHPHGLGPGHPEQVPVHCDVLGPLPQLQAPPVDRRGDDRDRVRPRAGRRCPSSAPGGRASAPRFPTRSGSSPAPPPDRRSTAPASCRPGFGSSTSPVIDGSRTRRVDRRAGRAHPGSRAPRRRRRCRCAARARSRGRSAARSGPELGVSCRRPSSRSSRA